LNELGKEAGERAIKYLMLTNAGGTVAMLSYFGANDEPRGLLPAKLALGFSFLAFYLLEFSTPLYFTLSKPFLSTGVKSLKSILTIIWIGKPWIKKMTRFLIESGLST
jgi:hypothetical protein